MGDYTITLKFDDQHVRELNQRRQMICFAHGVGSGPTYNVVAWQGYAASTVTIQGQAQYQIGVSNSRFMEGVRFSVMTQSDISPQQVITVDETWRLRDKREDRSLGSDTFRMINAGRDRVSAVVYERINGESTPIYFSQDPAGPQSNVDLSVKKKVAVWVQGNIEKGSLVSKRGNEISEFDLSSNNKVEARWNGQKFN